MRTVKDILIVILLLILVTLTYLQEDDILKLRHRVLTVEGGLMEVCNWINHFVKEANTINGGSVSASAPSGVGLRYFRSCSAVLLVTEPTIIGTKLIRGTGIFVSDNVLLTTKHVVEDRISDTSVRITGPDGVTYTAIEILEDQNDDLAVVIIQGRRGPWLSLGPWPNLGDDVICIGTPLNYNTQLIITWGRVSSEKYLNTFIYDGFCWPGCSGGPVIVGGKLAGIVESRLDGTASLGFAVPVERLDSSLMAWIK